MPNSPIFIGGLSFSGKTQLRLMLNSHPNIGLVRKTGMWSLLDRFGDLSNPDRLERCLGDLFASKTLREYDLDQVAIRRAFEAGARQHIRLFGLVYEACTRAQGKTRWGEQLGFIEQHADRIFEAYPKARMIHMIRDPRERFLASIQNKRERSGRAGWELARWQRSVRYACRNRKRFPDGYLILRYEELALDCERALQTVCEFVGEPFFDETAPECVQFRPVQQTLDKTHKLELAFIQQRARHDLIQLGYTPRDLPFSIMDWIGYIGYEMPFNLTTGLAWQILRARTPA